MAEARTYHTEHRIEVQAPAGTVYDLIAEVTNWPRIFPPSIHVEHLDRDGATERIRIWATANGEIKRWTSIRRLDPQARRITFRQEIPQAPVAAMSGAWILEPLDDTRTTVVLTHDFQAVGDTAENVEWVHRAVERNSAAELGALKAAAEAGTGAEDGLLSFEDVVHVRAGAKEVYDFLLAADRWPDRLPHVSRVVLDEPAPDVQRLEMDTRTSDGSVHTTESVRVCFAPDRIVYKQLRLPGLLSAHHGSWLVESEEDGVRITAGHTVVIDPAAIEGVLGADATMREARLFVRQALGRNSGTTMAHAKEYTEQGAADTVAPDVYASILEFYAGQMRLHDQGAADEWAATFAVDGEFAHNAAQEPVRGRADITSRARQALAAAGASGDQRRHWIGMVTARPGAGGTVHTSYYAMVLVTPKGGLTRLHLSAEGEDVLVRDGSTWSVRSRRISHDG